MYFKDSGIILNSYNSIDADKIVSVFFKKLGKISVVFKGIKKSKSQKLNSADIGNLTDIQLYKKNDDQLFYVKEIKIKKHFYKIKKDYIKYLYLNYINELFLFFVLPGESNEKLFNFLLNILTKLQTLDYNVLNKIIFYTEFRLIQYSGIMLDFSSCSVCQQKKELKEYLLDKNTLICASCLHPHTSEKLVINKRILNLLNKLDQCNLSNIDEIFITKEENIILEKLLYNIIITYLDKELKSYKILKEMIKNEFTDIS